MGEGFPSPFYQNGAELPSAFAASGLETRTILRYISALSSCMNRVNGMPVGRHPVMAKWVFGDRSQNAPRRSRAPPWDMSVILAVFTEKPFEPLHQARPQDLMLKTPFLIPETSLSLRFMLYALALLFLFRTFVLSVWL